MESINSRVITDELCTVASWKHLIHLAFTDVRGFVWTDNGEIPLL